MILYIIGKNPTVLIEKKPNKIQNLGLYSNIPLRHETNNVTFSIFFCIHNSNTQKITRDFMLPAVVVVSIFTVDNALLVNPEKIDQTSKYKHRH